MAAAPVSSRFAPASCPRIALWLPRLCPQIFPNPVPSTTLPSLQLLHAITAAVWRNMDEMKPKALSNVLYGFGLLNFHPGWQGLRSIPLLSGVTE